MVIQGGQTLETQHGVSVLSHNSIYTWRIINVNTMSCMREKAQTNHQYSRKN